MSSATQQSAPAVLMLRPANFGYNTETAESNSFQETGPLTAEQIRTLAIEEFDHAVQSLLDRGIHVVVFKEDFHPQRTDSVFVNNWVSFHMDGTVILYPMATPSRRLDRRTDVIDHLHHQLGYQVLRTIDFSPYEEQGMHLESTGSMIFDYEHRIIYACRSNRTDETLVKKVAEELGYQAMVFDAYDPMGLPIYHTNVLMCVGSKYVVICLEAVADTYEKDLLLQQFIKTEKEIIELSVDQMAHFAGNMLEVASDKVEAVLVMSEAAYQSLEEEQLKTLSAHAALLNIPIPTIEHYGGGSIRCMLAGIHLLRQ